MKKVICMVILMTMLFSSIVSAAEDQVIKQERVQHGDNWQVSTIVGNGVDKQTDRSVWGPRFPSVDGAGNTYFLDGDQKNLKLRKYNGNRIETIVDMKKDKVMSRYKEWYSTGTAFINGNVYFSTNEDVFRVQGKQAFRLDTGIKEWMKNEDYHYIFRMEQHNNDLYFMMWSKSWNWGFAKYDMETQSMELLLWGLYYSDPTNFFVTDEEGFLVSTGSGEIYYEDQYGEYSDLLGSMMVLNTNDGKILDVWADDEKTIYFSMQTRRSDVLIRTITKEDSEEVNNMVGSRLGYQDGSYDQVEMDYPTDFVWDGSGYIFADTYNHSIRKLWLDRKPMVAVQ